MIQPDYLLAVGTRMDELSDTPIFIMGFGDNQRTEVWVKESGDSMTQDDILFMASEKLREFVEHEFMEPGIEVLLEEGS